MYNFFVIFYCCLFKYSVRYFKVDIRYNVPGMYKNIIKFFLSKREKTNKKIVILKIYLK